MSKLKVKHVGPIKDGYQGKDGFMSFDGVTVFVGDQGGGKSTVAKLFSTLTWIEKSLEQGSITEEQVEKEEAVNLRGDYLAYQGIDAYLTTDSYIEYIGDVYRLKYEKGRCIVDSVNNADTSKYLPPKIMYVPAERNIVSLPRKLKTVKGLPRPFYAFYDEYENAREDLGELKLPIANSRIVFDKSSNFSILKGSGYAIDLRNASSGFQSLTPLIAVTAYLSSLVSKEHSPVYEPLSRHMREKIVHEVAKNSANKTLDEVMAIVETLLSKYRYQRFINIVEEPELNLYPTSQRKVLFELLKYHNQKPGNKLVMTTHSPFLISYLTLAIKAKELFASTTPTAKNKKTLERIVSMESTVATDDVAIYEMDAKTGTISALKKYHGIPSDENLLNQKLEEFNDTFATMLEMEIDGD